MCLPSVYLNMLSNIIQWATTFLIPVYRVVETILINTYNVTLHYAPYTQTIHVIFVYNYTILLIMVLHYYGTWNTFAQPDGLLMIDHSVINKIIAQFIG
jgi:hypothetical protein